MNAAREASPDMFEQFANIIVYQMAWQWPGLDAGSHTAAGLRFFEMAVTKIFFLLFVIIYIMRLLRTMLSPERVRQYVHAKPKNLFLNSRNRKIKFLNEQPSPSRFLRPAGTVTG